MLNFTELLGYKKQLDVFLTNEPQFWIKSKIGIKISNKYALNNKKCSDHYAYITRYECNYDQATDRSRPKYAYKRIDWINFNCNLSKNPFNPYCYGNVDELLKQWYEWFNRLFDQNVPRVTQHRSHHPRWVSKSTSHEMKKLSTLKRKAIAHPSPARSTLNKIDCLEEKVNTLCKNDQVIFESEIFATRQFSVIQKYLRSIKKVTPFPSEMHLNEETADTNEEKAELFILFFNSKVFNSKISKVENQFNFEEKDLNRFDISEKEIESILNKLDTSKDNRPDSNLKNLPKTISRSLLLLFQTFINVGTFPAYWKQSDITPIHKEGDKAAINMYRPINCLCCLSEVFEKLMFIKLYEHVKGTLHDSQFDFQPQRSAIIQMLCFLDQLYKEVDSIAHDELFVFYLDFQKAFDKVPYHSVVAKLSETGIGEKRSG